MKSANNNTQLLMSQSMQAASLLFQEQSYRALRIAV
jgi:hypothetical protein